ncbi:winged helix-turn-helix domain-containing protein [Enterobacter asburiae]|uniref:winged helix-turn-helix domain-containing protein n=1 Tax=Scandinavium sp. UTDF21-P1B TaxID=3446379 RepID=UPI00346FD8D5
MEYIINNSVKYSEANMTLCSLEQHSEVVILARITNSLLILFIENNNNLLTREFLLHEIWERQGLDSSSNNLNNYVSMLRKALLQFGCEDIIRTVPKHGFIFNGNIVFLPPKEHGDLSETSEKELPNNSKIINDAAIKRIKTTALIAICIIISFTPSLYESYRSTNVRHKVFNIGKCNFYIVDDDTKVLGTFDALENRMKDLMIQENFNCKHSANIYYFAQVGKGVKEKGFIDELLTYCPAGNKAMCYNKWLIND